MISFVDFVVSMYVKKSLCFPLMVLLNWLTPCCMYLCCLLARHQRWIREGARPSQPRASWAPCELGSWQWRVRLRENGIGCVLRQLGDVGPVGLSFIYVSVQADELSDSLLVPDAAHWKGHNVIILNFHRAPEVVKWTTSGASSDDNFINPG